MTDLIQDGKPAKGNVRRLSTFILTGGFAAACNLLSRAALSLILPFPVAVVIAYAIGMAVAFTMFRRFVFDARNGGIRGQAVRFFWVNMIALAQVFAISLLLNEIVLPALGVTWHREALAHVIGVAFPIVSSWFLHKHYTFKR